MADPWIWPINDDDRWAVVAALRARYDVGWVKVLTAVRKAERQLQAEEQAVLQESSRVTWRVMLADRAEFLLRTDV